MYNIFIKYSFLSDAKYFYNLFLAIKITNLANVSSYLCINVYIAICKMLRYLSVCRYLTKYICLPLPSNSLFRCWFPFFVFAILEGSKTWNWTHFYWVNDLPYSFLQQLICYVDEAHQYILEFGRYHGPVTNSPVFVMFVIYNISIEQHRSPGMLMVCSLMVWNIFISILILTWV